MRETGQQVTNRCSLITFKGRKKEKSKRKINYPKSGRDEALIRKTKQKRSEKGSRREFFRWMKQHLNNNKNRVKEPSEIIRQEMSQAEVRKRNSRNWLESLCVAVWKTVMGPATVVEQEDQEMGSVEKGREDEEPSQCALKEQL